MTKNDLAPHIFLVFVQFIHLLNQCVRKPCGITVVEDNRKVRPLVGIERQKSFSQINDELGGFRGALIRIVETVIAYDRRLVKTVIEILICQ
ncbi:MAG: hypothetical protein JW384_01129 [Nitrosomonadaceae bacterium]|nr:hypothetical protein [Nitrosomonadaceae bacterium]